MDTVLETGAESDPGGGDTTRQRIKFSDDRVCKSHLLNCCPHDVLSGTRMDLGECLKVHDLALRADYEIASKEQDFFFELDAMDHLQSFIADCDRRTEVAKKRLAETQEEISAEVAAKNRDEVDFQDDGGAAAEEEEASQIPSQELILLGRHELREKGRRAGILQISHVLRSMCTRQNVFMS